MTVDQFRAHDAYPILWKQELETNETLRMVLKVMEDASPDSFAIAGDNNDDVSPTRAAIELGFTRGYSKYSRTLRFLAIPKHKRPDLGETLYVKEDQPEEAT